MKKCICKHNADHLQSCSYVCFQSTYFQITINYNPWQLSQNDVFSLPGYVKIISPMFSRIFGGFLEDFRRILVNFRTFLRNFVKLRNFAKLMDLFLKKPFLHLLWYAQCKNESNVVHRTARRLCFSTQFLWASIGIMGYLKI